eukprot:1751494-Amphidinium_carterae.2
MFRVPCLTAGTILWLGNKQTALPLDSSKLPTTPMGLPQLNWRPKLCTGVVPSSGEPRPCGLSPRKTGRSDGASHVLLSVRTSNTERAKVVDTSHTLQTKIHSRDSKD